MQRCSGHVVHSRRTILAIVPCLLLPLTIALPAAAEDTPEGRSAPIDVTARGSLPKEAIDGEIRMHLGEIQACYQRELNRQPSLEGEVVVKFEISPDGTVAWVEVERTDMDHTSVPACVCEEMGRIEYPAPLGGGVVRVTYPFRFRSVAGHSAPGGEGDDPVGPPLPPQAKAAPPSDDLDSRTVRRLRRASLALANGRPERAETLFHRAWFGDPNCGACARGLASALMAQDRHDAALRVLTERITWFQHDTRTWALRASCAYTIDEHEEARTSLDVYFDLVGGMPMAGAGAAEGDAGEGDGLEEFVWCTTMRGAVGLYTDYLLDDERTRDAGNALALVRDHCGPDPGLDALDAWVLAASGKPRVAVADLDQLLSAHPTDPFVLATVDQFADQYATFATSSLLDAADPYARARGALGLAALQQKRDDPLGCIEHADRASRSDDPDLRRVAHRLGLDCALATEDLDRVLEWVERSGGPAGIPGVLVVPTGSMLLGHGLAQDALALTRAEGTDEEVEACVREETDRAVAALDPPDPPEEPEEPGDATTAAAPWTVPPPEGTTWRQVEVTWAKAAALRDDGRVVGWNIEGDDSAWWDWTGDEAVAQITMSLHGCALGEDGSVRCGSCLPMMDAGACDVPQGTFTRVDTGAMHSCGVRADGTAVCWGCGGYGEGKALPTDRGQCSAPGGWFVDVSAGQDHTCGLRDDGSIACWGCGEPGGRYDHGQCDAPAGHFVAMQAAYQHSCALRADGSLSCWGCVDALDPGACSPPDTPFAGLVESDEQACALTDAGEVVCWSGTLFFPPSTTPLGYPLPAHEETNAGLTPPPGAYTQVSLGVDGGCGIRADGMLVCWGEELETVPPPP